MCFEHRLARCVCVGFVSVRVPRPCHRSCGELQFPSPVLTLVAQSRHCIKKIMCVEGNVIYSLVPFIIFLRNIFLALIICMHDEGMENVSLA